MKFSQKKIGRDLVVTIELENGSHRLETLISTLDEIVSHAEASVKSIEASAGSASSFLSISPKVKNSRRKITTK